PAAGPVWTTTFLGAFFLLKVDLRSSHPCLGARWDRGDSSLHRQYVKFVQMPRQYRLGRRQELVDRTAQSILSAARDLVSQKPAEAVSVGAIARHAGVSRLTVYQRFGSRSGLLAALAPISAAAEAVEGDPRDALRRHLVQACA